ncbi:hypothetical protein LRS06_15900 [Hymenobacter sp. J193]|uniref:hypothetical protein n=1 Tax=Hymenobacter sp. J193 TaxID=2898429 RepID=UPI002151614F|nr:hypothetical protein [Hymenobacter sp. J193]MCR5889221.1 hypothetical protein [Hymenobacter sp. J193]
MKRLLFLAFFLPLLSWTGRAQAQTIDTQRYEYCELLTTDNLFSPDNKAKTGDIFVDFGYGFEKLGGGSLSQREAGKLQVFATHVSALTYMGKLGWEVVQMYQQTDKRPAHTLFVLRRPARGN